MLPRGINENTDYKGWGELLKVDGNSANWRLQANEAVVLFGDSPPEMKYWGMTNYQFTTYFENENGRNKSASPFV